MTLKPLPSRPPPRPDELLSSWTSRLAAANHCPRAEFLRYLGFRDGEAPDFARRLKRTDIRRVAALVRAEPDEIVAMTLPEMNCDDVLQCTCAHAFQYCARCVAETPRLVLRHWRLAWSVDCESCGERLTPTKPAGALSERLVVRAKQGAIILRSAVLSDDRRRLYRFATTLSVMRSLRLAGSFPLTTPDQQARFTALAALHAGIRRPLLGLATMLCDDDWAFQQLSRDFPPRRRVIQRLRPLSRKLANVVPRPPNSPPSPDSSHGKTWTNTPQPRHLNAAMQAIAELGRDADQRVLLKRAGELLLH